MQVKLPPLGEGADSGTVAGIFIKAGDSIQKDQPIIELESEKAVASIPSPASGIVDQVLVKEGDEVRVGQAILVLRDSAEAKRDAPEKPEDTVKVSPAGELIHEPAEPVKPLPEGIPPAAAPSVRKLAQSLGIDLSAVRGSARGGRIVLEDLKTYIQDLRERSAQPERVESKPPAAEKLPDFSHWGTFRRERIPAIRQAIMRKMVESWTRIPHVTQFDDADITDIQRMRKIHGPFYEKKKARLTLTPFVLKALVDCLKQHPVFASSIDSASQELIYKEYFHFGIAVDTEHGLLVPVIRDVDKKSLLELSLELEDLAARARERTLTIDEMQGGVFTVSNQGGIGGGYFTPIINAPEVAILGVGRGREQTVVLTGRVQRRIMLPLALSYDHRAIDGANAVRFLHSFVQRLEGFREAEVRIKP